MSCCWLALLEAHTDQADAQAPAVDATGVPAGWFTAWYGRRKPVRSARRVDARIVDPEGPAAWVSLVRPPDGVRLPFDDLAVQQARRDVLAGHPHDAVSTLMGDASHFEGAVTVARGEAVTRLGADPFARVFPARILSVAAGLFGKVPPPCGPTIERYGSAQPWPWDRFA